MNQAKGGIWILGAAVLAAFSIGGVFYWSGWQIEKKEAELIKLEAQAEQLKDKLATAQESYALALESSQETQKRLVQARLDLIKIQQRHKADLAAARKKTEAAVQVIETRKKDLPTLDDQQLATRVEKDLPGAVIFPLEPAQFQVNRETLIQVGILSLDLQACREMNLLVVKEKDTALLDLKLEKQISASWKEQFESKETECAACAAVLETSRQLEANLTQRLEAEHSRADAWARKAKLQKYFTLGGFAVGVVGGILVGGLAQ